MKISGCIITKNEEPNIAKCINSLKNVTDEIILVDTGSGDDTIRIATELGAMVYEHEWENDFSKAKNTALEYATGDWIIFVDADEYFSNKSLPKVRTIIQKVNPDLNIEGIQCELANIDSVSKKIIGSVDILRIFRNNKTIRFINRIHEEIRNKGEVLKCINVKGELVIIHTGYSSFLQQKKAERNLELISKNMDDEKAAYYLAITYHILNDFDNAYKYSELALANKEICKFDYMAYKLHLIKIAVSMESDRYNRQEIRRLIDAANQDYGNHPEIAKVEALYYYKERQYKKACEKYLYALECQDKYGESFAQNDFIANLHEVYYNLAEILYFMNQEADSLYYYLKLLKLNKYNEEAFISMFRLFISTPEDEIIVFINSIYDLKNEIDVKFVISHAAKCGKSKVVLYYANQWNNIYGHEDDVLIYAFISQGRYLNALEIALLYLQSDKDLYSPLVASIIIMGQLFSEVRKVKEKVGDDFYDIVVCYGEEKKYTGNKEAYLSVFSILANYVDQYDITNYINIDGGPEINTDIAGILLTDFHFNHAIYYYNKLFKVQKNNKFRNAVIAFKLGYCFYKLRQFPESLDWFDKAIMNGYTENDLNEYLNWIADQSSESDVQRKARILSESYLAILSSEISKLHIGCGRDIKAGWINLDFIDLPGIDVVANLDTCRTIPLPFEDNTIDEILASHVIEHINDPLPMMQELYRIAKPNAKAVFRCPYGTSDDAYEDPTHVKQYFLHSFGYFSQPYYWRADYGYRGDWCTDKIILVVDQKKYKGKKLEEVWDDISKYRNTVIEMIVEMHAEKPAREPREELIIEPIFEIQYL